MQAFLILLLFVVLVWDPAWQLAGVKPILPARLKRMLAAKEDPPVLVDVRTPFEYEKFHINEAVLHPNALRNPEAFEMDDRERPIVVVCLSGHRSAIAAYRLKKRGFKPVYYLAWGMLAWLLGGGQIVKGRDANMKV